MNYVLMTGRLTRDPEVRYSSAGKAIVNFTLASNRPFTNAQGEKEADFINFVAFGKQAEVIADHVRKGHRLNVVGRLQSGSYTNKKGEKVFTVEVIVNEFEFVEKAENKKKENPADYVDPFENNSTPIDIGDDDLPF